MARAVLCGALVVGAVAACSSDDGDSAGGAADGTADTTGLQAPTFGGTFTCEDEAGDQLDGASRGETPVSTAVPGTDLTEARVEVVDDELVVHFTVDGDVQADDDPRFVVSKGLLQQPATWFELRAFVEDGSWVVQRRRLPERLDAIGAAQERIDVLPVPVEVTGATVRLAVPLDQLPPIDGTPTWQFGTAAADGAVFDDCNELVD